VVVVAEVEVVVVGVGKVEEGRTCVVYCRSGRPGPGFRVLTFYSFLEWTIVAAVKDQHPDDDGGDKRNETASIQW